MRFIPSPPTDNIHKFKAILGLLISTLFLAFLFYLKYLSFHFEKANELQMYAIKAESTLKKIDCRLEAIKVGRIEKCPFDPLLKDGSEKEIESLIFRRAVQERQISNYKVHADISKPINDNVEWVVASHLNMVLGAVAGTGIVLFVVGFRDWHLKVQKNADEINEIDLELKKVELKIKNLELSKLEMEVGKLQKPKWLKISRKLL